MKRDLNLCKAGSILLVAFGIVLGMLGCANSTEQAEDSVVAATEDAQSDGAQAEDQADGTEGQEANATALPPVEEQPLTTEAAKEVAKGPVVGAAPAAGGSQGVLETNKTHEFIYTIKRGDWLSKIARRVYGDLNQWPKIHALNPEIQNPNRIHVGQKIKVPILDAQSEAFAAKYKAGHKSDRGSVRSPKKTPKPEPVLENEVKKEEAAVQANPAETTTPVQEAEPAMQEEAAPKEEEGSDGEEKESAQNREDSSKKKQAKKSATLRPESSPAKSFANLGRRNR